MTQLTPWRRKEGLADLMPFDQWMREFRDFLSTNGKWPFETAMPRANVAETDKDYRVSLELPGVDPKDVEVELKGHHLVVTGERKQKKTEKDEHHYLTESVYGAFERRFELPEEVLEDSKKIEATFRNGLLEITIPKAAPKSAAKIPIKNA